MTSFDCHAFAVRLAFPCLKKSFYAFEVPCWGAWVVAQVSVKVDGMNILLGDLPGEDQDPLAS